MAAATMAASLATAMSESLKDLSSSAARMEPSLVSEGARLQRSVLRAMVRKELQDIAERGRRRAASLNVGVCREKGDAAFPLVAATESESRAAIGLVSSFESDLVVSSTSDQNRGSVVSAIFPQSKPFDVFQQVMSVAPATRAMTSIGNTQDPSSSAHQYQPHSRLTDPPDLAQVSNDSCSPAVAGFWESNEQILAPTSRENTAHDPMGVVKDRFRKSAASSFHHFPSSHEPTSRYRLSKTPTRCDTESISDASQERSHCRTGLPRINASVSDGGLVDIVRVLNVQRQTSFAGNGNKRSGGSFRELS